MVAKDFALIDKDCLSMWIHGRMDGFRESERSTS